MRALVLAVLACLAGFVGPANAEDQRLRLRSGWNLISFAVTPADPSPAAVLDALQDQNVLQALWAYDAATGAWSTYPKPAEGVPVIATIDTAHGYWIKVSQDATLDVTGNPVALPVTPNALAAGWNLVAFPTAQPIAYDVAVGDPAVREIWTFAPSGQGFLGIVIDAVSGRPTRLDFTSVEAGKGYWVRTSQATTLAPELITLLQPDIDFPPLVQGAEIDKAVSFTKSPNDFDIGGDGLYDRPRTQRAVGFGQNLEQLRFQVYNGGAGLLVWRATLDGWKTRSGSSVPPFVQFRVDDPDTGAAGRVEQVSGLSAGDTNQVTLVVDRTGLPPGEYEAHMTIVSNATAEGRASQTDRDIRVFVSVGDFDGLYEVSARIDTVDGKAARLANPRFYLALYRDPDGLKGVVDDRLSVFVPKRLRLVGDIYQEGTTRLEISGAIGLAADDQANPYGRAMRRDLTLRGARRTPENPADAALAPLDLRGEYLETIRGVLPTPIRLVGTFVAKQVSPSPQLIDETGAATTSARGIPDGGSRDAKLAIPVKELITEVDVTVNLDHPDPTDVKATLIHPDGTQIVLRDHGPGFTGSVVYDERLEPVESLDRLIGKLSNGEWTLRIEDTEVGNIGTLRGWSLRIRGTQVHAIAGTIDGVGAGQAVHLTGCGQSRIGTTGDGGSYSFDDLIDCPYQVRLLSPGFRSSGIEVLLGGQDVAGVTFSAVADPGYVAPEPIRLPAGGAFSFTALSTSGGAGVYYEGRPDLNPPVPPLSLAQQYAADAATFDLDRPPLVSSEGVCPGDEDANAFGRACDETTMSHVLEDNTCRIDGPECPRSFRAVLAIGAPVIGQSASGNRQLFIGAKP